jgi:hypothetical protein
MIISRIRNPTLPAMVYLENEDTKGRMGIGNETAAEVQGSSSLFRIYNDAANEGFNYGSDKCQTRFGKECQYSMDKLLNMPTLRFWTAMQRLLRISFKDGDSIY